LERRLHASRFRDICAVVWRHDELGNHVQFKCNFDEKAALALEREVGAGGSAKAVWEERPRCSDVSVDVGVTRFGEVITVIFPSYEICTHLIERHICNIMS
jgi:hypothetical protein